MDIRGGGRYRICGGAGGVGGVQYRRVVMRRMCWIKVWGIDVMDMA